MILLGKKNIIIILTYGKTKYIYNSYVRNYVRIACATIFLLNKNGGTIMKLILYFRNKITKYIYKFLKIEYAKRFLNSFKKPYSFTDNNGSLIKFTRRKHDCISIFLQGRSIDEIGLVLNISPKVVEYLIENIEYKLNNDFEH